MKNKKLLIDESDVEQIEQVAKALEEISMGTPFPRFIMLSSGNLKKIVGNIKAINNPPLATGIKEKLAIHRVGSSDPMSILTQECSTCGAKVHPGAPLYFTIEESNGEKNTRLHCEKCALELREKNV